MTDETLDQSWLRRLRNRPWIASIVALGVVLGGIASASNAVRDIVSLFAGKKEIGQPQASSTATEAQPKATPQPSQMAEQAIVGSWQWATYADGRTMWVTVHADHTMESTIHGTNVDGSQSEVINNTGTWLAVSAEPPQYELHWSSSPQSYVVTNFVRLSTDHRQLLENDKGQLIVRGTRPAS